MKQEKTKCITNKIFLDVFLKGAEIGRQNEFIDHVFSCPECRLKFETLNALRRELRTKEKELPCLVLSRAEEKTFRKTAKSRLRELSGRRPKAFVKFGRLRLFRLISASAAIVIFFLGGYLILNSVIRQKSLRMSDYSRVRLIEPKGELKAVPTFFRWSAFKNAYIYRFKIISDDLETIHEIGIPQTSIQISAEIKDKLKDGKTYIWSIEAIDDEGRRLSFSQDYFKTKMPRPY